MNDRDVPRWLQTMADMIDNARDMEHGAVIRIPLSPYMAQQFEDAAKRAVELLAPAAVQRDEEPFRLPSFRFERRQAG